jgi:hypothetical protein
LAVAEVAVLIIHILREPQVAMVDQAVALVLTVTVLLDQAEPESKARVSEEVMEDLANIMAVAVAVQGGKELMLMLGPTAALDWKIVYLVLHITGQVAEVDLATVYRAVMVVLEEVAEVP